MRNHNWKFDKYECGEGNMCSWIPLAAAAIGAVGSYLSSKNANKSEDKRYQDYTAANQESQKLHFNPVVEPYIKGIMGDAEDIYGRQGFAPDPNALQLMGRENQLGYAENALPGMIENAQGSWSDMLSGGMNPYVEQMIAGANNNLAQNFQRNVLPHLSGAASGSGGFGSGRHQINEGIASEGLLEAMGNSTTNILNNAYNTGQSNKISAMNMAPMMTGLGYMPSQKQMDIGGLYRGDAMNPAANLQGYAGMINPYSNQSGGAAVSPPPTPGSPLAAGFGGAMTGYDLANRFWGSPNPQSGSQPMTATNVGNYRGYSPNDFRTWM